MVKIIVGKKKYPTLWWVICLSGLVVGICLFGRNLMYQSHQFSTAALTRPPGSEHLITLHYYERPPFYVTGPDEVLGLCIDPVKQAFKKAGIPYRMINTPANRHLDIIRQNQGLDGVIGWFKTPEREAYARYSIPIYQDAPMMAIALAGNGKIKNGFPAAQTLKNQSLKLLVKEGYSYGVFIDSKIAKIHPTTIVTSADNIGMLRMIYGKRADYFFISKEEADVIIANSGFDKSLFQYIYFSDVPKGNHRYLLFSKKVKQSIVDEINQALLQVTGIADPDSETERNQL